MSKSANLDDTTFIQNVLLENVTGKGTITLKWNDV